MPPLQASPGPIRCVLYQAADARMRLAQALRSLQKAFVIQDLGLLETMVTIHREGRLRISIFNDDHDPAHVHVTGNSEAKVNLIGPEGRPTLVWNTGLSKGDLRRALRIIIERQGEFLARWRAIHG